MTSSKRRHDVAHELLVATRSLGKARELRSLLAPLRLRVVDLDDAQVPRDAQEDAIENAETFEGNALAKAHYFRARSAGRPVLADDSGLCVAALNGAPGVRSRRYAGATGTEALVSQANSDQLLHALHGVADRRAEFVCAVAYVDDTRESVCVGRTPGRILETPEGNEGFGYDPLFWSNELGRTFGEVSAAEKSGVSHRARAVAQLVERLRAGAGATSRG